MLYAFNPQGLAQFLAFHRPSVNVHRPELLDSSQRMEGTHSVKVLENICVFSAQHLPSIIEEIETERSQAKYKVICRSLATPFSKVGMFSPSLQTADQMVS